MTRSTPESVGAIALLTAALFALLALSERAGLPLGWTKPFLCILAVLVFLLVVTLGRTTLERQFFGLETSAHPILGGVVAGVAATFATNSLTRPADGASWLAVMLGVVTGLLGAHTLARLTRRVERMPAHQLQAATAADSFRGFALLLIGSAVLLAAADIAGQEVARMFGLANGLAISLVLALGVIPALAGGGQGAILAAVGFHATAVSLAVLLLTATGASLGPLPLPGQSDAGTLEAIQAARNSWGIEQPLHFTTWPDIVAALSGANLRSFAFATLVAGGLALAMVPVVPVARRTTVIVGSVVAVLLPVTFIALGGYAIEAAAVRFIGALIAKPPPSLVEASQLGLVSACGVSAATAEAIRTACGVSPRDTTVFAWEQIRLTPAFVESGFAVALGYSAAFSIATSATKLLMALGLAILGIWFAAKGLGRDILARSNTAAGLASLRMGQTRLAAALIAGSALCVTSMGLSPPREFLVFAAVSGAFLIFVAAALKLRRPPVDQSLAAPPPARKRRKKPPVSPEGEPA